MAEPLTLRFLGALIEQLGAQLYPGATATIAELISNAWDADAENVWVDVPLGSPWIESNKIVVTDDGSGMSRDDARDNYLLVGRKRRVLLDSDKTKGGRPLHGRKGIGKLAAFGTAKVLECHTVSTLGDITSFRLDYDQIRSLDPAEDYEVEDAQDSTALGDPAGNRLAHGTRITLSTLKPRRAMNENQFRQSLSRRFALSGDEMQVHINGKTLGRFEYPIEFRFPRDGQLLEERSVTVARDGWGEASIGEDRRPVRWWIGFTEKPIRDKEMQGVSVLARGKMVQRPFLFQRTAGAEGQLGQEYLVGEVQADWLDEGYDIDTDLIQANRDQLQLEDTRLNNFVEWGQDLVRRALRERNDLRANRVASGLDIANFKDLLERLTTEERRRLNRVTLAVSRVPEITIEEGRSLIESIVNAHGDTIVREMLESIDSTALGFQTQLWDVVRRFELIDARRNQTIINARLKAIAKLRDFVSGGALEVPTIHEHIKEHPWLLDPRWYLLGDELKLSNLGIEPDQGEHGGQMDFLFALGPSAPYTHDELLVVEIKRGTKKDGTVRAANSDEVSRFHKYVLAAHESQQRAGKPLRVTGLMIAQRYTRDADMMRASLATVGNGVRLVFSTWDGVLQETERLHEGWLAVTTRRAKDESEE